MRKVKFRNLRCSERIQRDHLKNDRRFRAERIRKNEIGKEQKTMKFIYPAVFRQTENGGYKAWFPDLECCEASGETLEDAIENANEAARTWITVELEEDDPLLPYVSDHEDIETEEGDIIRNISVNIRFYEGWDE